MVRYVVISCKIFSVLKDLDWVCHMQTTCMNDMVSFVNVVCIWHLQFLWLGVFFWGGGGRGGLWQGLCVFYVLMIICDPSYVVV